MTQTVLKYRPEHVYSGDNLIYWYNPRNGVLIFPDGQEQRLSPSIELHQVLSGIARNARIINKNSSYAYLYLGVGNLKKNRPDSSYFQVRDGWHDDLQLERKGYHRYRRDGFTLHLYSTANYAGEELDLGAIGEAYYKLQALIAQAFKLDHYRLLATPAMTGKDLLEISLPMGKQYPPLEDSLADMIHHNFGQARIEHLPPQVRKLDGGAYILDGYWMYAGCLSHLPIGEPKRDHIDRFEGGKTKAGHLAPHVPGFYKVRFQVPDGWSHIGLLQAESYNNAAQTGFYPRIPDGQTFTNWTTAAELAVALDHLWPVEIIDRILWPYTGDSKDDPLAAWRKRLVDLRESIPDRGKVNKLMRGMIRQIVLHTVGSFHRTGTIVERITPVNEPLGNRRMNPVGHRIVGKERHWKEIVPLADKQLRFMHPEWSATVWGRARAKLAQFALTIPFEHIISLRTDSIWVTTIDGLTIPTDNLKPGDFRLKDRIEYPFVWPTTSEDMRSFIIRRNMAKNDAEEIAAPDYDDLEEEE